MTDRTPFNLTVARIEAGLSINALSRETGVPAPAISRLEAGLKVRPDRAKVIADRFGVKVTDLEAFAEVAA